jgi:pimeloyl-ACP methyl ester carboxylesterase
MPWRTLPWRAAASEVVATVRSAGWPVARLVHPLPAPPATDRPPVVLLHGYLGHPDVFRPLTRRLYEAGFGRVVAPGYPSTRWPLDAVVRRLGDVVGPLAREHGQVHLVGHSLGAVACRAYLKVFGGAEHVRSFVSLGGPHAGTALWRLAPPTLWDVLRPDGAWVRRLSVGPEPVPTTVIRSRYDQQVLPPVRAQLPGATEQLLTGTGHNGLLWSRSAHDAVLRALTDAEPCDTGLHAGATLPPAGLPGRY